MTAAELVSLLQMLTVTVSELARIWLYWYGVKSATAFLTHWLDTRTGLPLFTTPRLTREAAIDAARRYGITNEEINQTEGK